MAENTSEKNLGFLKAESGVSDRTWTGFGR
jgi:hypothetical protein